MWIMHEGVVELYDADILLLLMLSAMLSTASLCLLANSAPRTI